MPLSHTDSGFSNISTGRQRRLSRAAEEQGALGPALTPIFLGIAAAVNGDTVSVALAAHDQTYLLDYAIEHLALKDDSHEGEDIIADYVVQKVEDYEHRNLVKFIGAGLASHITKMSPTLCSRLWLDADIVPIVLSPKGKDLSSLWEEKELDEQADSMARKCVITATWDALMHYAGQLKQKGTKIAFFSATPQGGGVALMRHALVRFCRLIGVDLSCSKTAPGRLQKYMQGVSKDGERLSDDEKTIIAEWISSNAERYWLSKGGPLRPVDEGGADVIVIDDPQMPGLIPLVKKLTPNRPVLYRSHIQIRSDLIAQPGSPQADVWDFLWKNIQQADLFISHPIPKFVPHTVPPEMVTYMPATTDWIDGLNKHLNRWVSAYYINNYNAQCRACQMAELDFGNRKYIVQIARFDPAKGIPTVIESYAEFRRRAEEEQMQDIPQLVVAGNGSIDDPDGNAVHDETLEQIEQDYPDLAKDISVMRLDANDQLLNALIANAHVVLQLSTREGFEVKVSEALHAGRPVIATLAGGIPLQVKNEVNGFLVEPADYKAVAGHLVQLFKDRELWERMSQAAKTGVSDEVCTAGNALAWFYLAAKFSGAADQGGKSVGVQGHGKWVNDLAREEAGCPYEEGENRLPRWFTKQEDLPRTTQEDIRGKPVDSKEN
ncbi:hypothetical protein DL764_001953 [Monosporascus ibericus]|uniref:Uncharacterized protein n=1 Tax=Monosporascus ibericus TaxID=155417 RepID=A0A4Q4TPZ2_9PEZI|nr:hypothetical protein DL764_001953 [Monosporascus ibericus]